MCLWIIAYRYVGTCIEARGQFLVPFLRSCPSWLFETGILTFLEFTNLSRLAGQWAYVCLSNAGTTSAWHHAGLDGIELGSSCLQASTLPSELSPSSIVEIWNTVISTAPLNWLWIILINCFPEGKIELRALPHLHFAGWLQESLLKPMFQVPMVKHRNQSSCLVPCRALTETGVL